MHNIILSGIMLISSFFPWMDYRTIKSSEQLAIQHRCITDEYGFRRYEGKFVIAAPPNYDLREDLILCIGGSAYNCIVGDIRPAYDDKIEFIVDKDKISKKIRKSGNCFSRFKQ